MSALAGMSSCNIWWEGDEVEGPLYLFLCSGKTSIEMVPFRGFYGDFQFGKHRHCDLGSTYDLNTPLSIRDLGSDNAHNPSVTFLNIKHSKTDQGRKGVRVVIGRHLPYFSIIVVPSQER